MGLIPIGCIAIEARKVETLVSKWLVILRALTGAQLHPAGSACVANVRVRPFFCRQVILRALTRAHLHPAGSACVAYA